jgi:hypothetical protein
MLAHVFLECKSRTILFCMRTKERGVQLCPSNSSPNEIRGRGLANPDRRTIRNACCKVNFEASYITVHAHLIKINL